MKIFLPARLTDPLVRFGKQHGIDMPYFLKNSFLVSVSHGINLLKGLVIGLLVARMFPIGQYGEYRFMLSFLGFIGFIGLTSLGAALGKSIANKETVPLRSTIQLYSLLTAVGALVIFCSTPLLSYWGRESLWPFFIIGGILYVPVKVGGDIFDGLIRGTGNFDLALRTNFYMNIILVTGILLMLWLRPSSLLLLTLTYGLPCLFFLWNIRSSLKKYRGTASGLPILKKAAQMSLATLPITISWYIDGLLVTAFFGLDQLAVFSVALMPPEQVKIWIKELLQVSFSRQALGKDTSERREKMNQVVVLGFIFLSLAVLLYILAAPWLLPLLFPQYPKDDMVLWSRMGALALLPLPGSLYIQHLEARGMVKQLQKANFLSSMAFCFLLILLIPTIGPVGAVIARGAFRGLYSLSAWLLMKAHPLDA